MEAYFSPKASSKDIKSFWLCLSKGLKYIQYIKSKKNDQLTLQELEDFLNQIFNIKSKEGTKKTHQAFEIFKPIFTH